MWPMHRMVNSLSPLPRGSNVPPAGSAPNYTPQSSRDCDKVARQVLMIVCSGCDESNWTQRELKWNRTHEHDENWESMWTLRKASTVRDLPTVRMSSLEWMCSSACWAMFSALWPHTVVMPTTHVAENYAEIRQFTTEFSHWFGC